MRAGTVAVFACVALAALLPTCADASSGWLPPIEVAKESSPPEEPQVAVDSHGDALLVWKSRSGANHFVRGAMKPADAPWQTPVTIGWCGEATCRPQVAFDQRGDAFALWEEYTGYTFNIVSSYMPASGTWEAPVTLSSFGIPGASRPRLAVDDRGDAIAVWDRGSASNAVTQDAFRPSKGSWGPEMDVSPEGDSAFDPEVGLDQYGNALVLWSHFDSAQNGEYKYSVQAAEGLGGKIWQMPIDLSGPGAAGEPQVAFGGTGEAVALWDQWSNGFLSPQTPDAAIRTAADAWDSPASLTEGKDETDQPKGAETPAVAMDRQGNAIAVWAWRFADTIQASFRPVGDSWQEPVDISAFEGGARDPHVAFDRSGNAFAGWLAKSGVSEAEIVQAAFKPAEGAWGEPVDISDPSQVTSAPSFAFDEAGDGVAAWIAENSIWAAGSPLSRPVHPTDPEPASPLAEPTAGDSTVPSPKSQAVALPAGGEVFTARGDHRAKFSLTLVTSTNGRLIEAGAATTSGKHAHSGGSLTCGKSAVTFGFPQTALTLQHGAYGFRAAFTKRKKSVSGSDKAAPIRLELVGRVVDAATISGTIGARGGGCSTRKPISFVARVRKNSG